jgi:hypothetical protein
MPSLAPEAYGRFFASRTPRFYAEDAWLGSAIPEPVPPGTLDATRPYVLVAALERPGPM